MKKIFKYKYLLITIIFIILAFIIFGSNSFHINIWFDEAYQMILNNYSIPQIISYVAKDTSGPLYAILLKITTTIFGKELYIGRLLSLSIFSIQFILAFYPIRRLYNFKTSLVFSMLVILSTISSFASIEIRLYSLAMTCTLGTIIYSLLYLKEDKNSDLIKYFLFALCTLHTHNYAMLSTLFIIFTNIIYSLTKKKDKKMLLTNISLVVLYIPWFIVLMKQFLQVKRMYWISPPSFILIEQSIQNLLTANNLINIILFILITISIIKSIREKKELKSVLYYLIPSFGIIIVIYLYSVFFTPIFMPKYITPVSAIIYLIIAKIISNNKSIILPSIFIILLIPNFINTYKEEKHLADDSLIKEAISIIEELPKESFAFYDGYEFNLGLESYYFPNYKHYIARNLNYIINTPEIYGNTIRAYNMKEQLIVTLVPLNIPERYIPELINNGYRYIAEYRFFIEYNDGFMLYIYEKANPE